MKLCELKYYTTLVFIIFFSSNALAETTVAYVHFGAIVLGNEPKSNHARRPRVGYLPIGTIVYYDDKAVTNIFNYSEDVQDYEDYVYVQSNIGFVGFIKKDLVSTLNETEKLVPLRYNIVIREIDSKKIVDKISRAETKSNAQSLEIIGEDEQHYHVRLTWKKNDNGSSKEGRICKTMVNGVHVVKLSKDLNKLPPIIKLSTPAEFITNYLSKFSNYVADKTGENADKIIELLSLLNALQCRVSSTADAELSAKIFGTGLGLNFTFVMAEKNSIYSIKNMSFRTDKQSISEYYVLRDVKCQDGIPNRLENLIILHKNNPADQIIISKNGLPQKLKENWFRFDIKSSKKMINIDGFPAYKSFMDHLGQANYLNELPYEDRLILSHMLLKEVAYFSTPN